MNGIRYVVDEAGRRSAVVIDLSRYGALWQDFQDALVVNARKHEPRESLEQVRKRLVRSGRLP
jgi:hypothetical protein